jgi:hypothetical protein
MHESVSVEFLSDAKPQKRALRDDLSKRSAKGAEKLNKTLLSIVGIRHA